MALVVSRFDIYLVSLDPAQGREIRKTRPCVVISPDEMNQYLQTVVIAPMTTVRRPYPTRVVVRFHGKRGEVALDQLRAVAAHRRVRQCSYSRRSLRASAELNPISRDVKPLPRAVLYLLL